MGRLRPHGDTGGAAGRAHVLTSTSSGEAIAYTLTFENPAPPWDAERRLGLPPRLAHIYVRQGYDGGPLLILIIRLVRSTLISKEDVLHRCSILHVVY